MLKIIVPKADLYDSKKEEFVQTSETTLLLEHSLVSISKWEAETHKPFLSKDEKTQEEILKYIKHMVITQNVPDNVYYALTQQNIRDITNYIQDSQTATWFYEDKNENKAGGRSQVITSELIYCWMTQLEIPWEAQKWHLNRLLTLIRVINEENKPKKKRSQKDIISRNADLNAQRLAKLHSKG